MLCLLCSFKRLPLLLLCLLLCSVTVPESVTVKRHQVGSLWAHRQHIRRLRCDSVSKGGSYALLVVLLGLEQLLM